MERLDGLFYHYLHILVYSNNVFIFRKARVSLAKTTAVKLFFQCQKEYITLHVRCVTVGCTKLRSY